MLRRFLNAKIRDIRITGTFVEYEGSIKIDENYIEKAGMLQWEEVQVLNLENTERFTTYIIKGERGSGIIELNGPAALLGKIGDRIMVLTYANLSEEEIAGHTPRIVHVGRDV
jgi:aspartate 1-decarboxylase